MEYGCNCYTCSNRITIQNSAHSKCKQIDAKVIGSKYGEQKGWFNWPNNFDPVWLIDCNSFKKEVII